MAFGMESKTEEQEQIFTTVPVIINALAIINVPVNINVVVTTNVVATTNALGMVKTDHLIHVRGLSVIKENDNQQIK